MKTLVPLEILTLVKIVTFEANNLSNYSEPFDKVAWSKTRHFSMVIFFLIPYLD